MCMKTLLKVLDYSVVYKKVFSEVGLLEVLITCLHRFAAAVKEREALQGAVFPHFLFVFVFDISDMKISDSNVLRIYWIRKIINISYQIDNQFYNFNFIHHASLL